MVTWFFPAAVMEPSALMLPDMMMILIDVAINQTMIGRYLVLVMLMVVVGEWCCEGAGGDRRRILSAMVHGRRRRPSVDRRSSIVDGRRLIS